MVLGGCRSFLLLVTTAFKRGSSFCSSSRPYLQNKDPTDFASADNEQSI